jgi:hypothetical protein
MWLALAAKALKPALPLVQINYGKARFCANIVWRIIKYCLIVTGITIVLFIMYCVISLPIGIVPLKVINKEKEP